MEMRAYNLVTMRNYMAEEALKGGAEWLFWLDDDMMGPPNVLEALLAINKPIACGLYMAKKKASERGLAAWMETKTAGSPYAPGVNGYMSIQRQQAGRVIQVDVTGLGCALINRSVFEKLPKPWFTWDVGALSEDFTFFERVWASQGIKPVLDMECKFDHIGVFKVNVEGEFSPLEM